MKYEFNLTLTDTNVLKGIGLLLLLLHHLFYIKSGLYDDIHLYNDLFLVNELGKFGKLCVAIFVFLSGYGLTKQVNKNNKIQLWKFYKRRFSKLYLNYWFIWLIFVPLGIIFFNRTFDIVYINHIWEKLFIDILGLSFAFGFYGYNATWWFYSCIIILYLLFPFLYHLLKVNYFYLLIISLAIYFSDWVIFRSFNLYLISFSLGMILAHGVNDKLILPFYSINKWILWLLFLSICIMRIKMGTLSILWDTIICLVGIILYKRIHIWNLLTKTLEFIGKHSMNIFLFHTFIYSYYFENIIFYFRNPIIIYFLLLFICIFISIAIELIKEKINYAQFSFNKQ